MDADNLYRMARTQQLAVIHVVCLVVAYLAHRRSRKRNRVNLPSQELMLHRQALREEMLQDLSTNTNCRKTIRNDFRTRFVSWLYRRSVSATSRHFHRVQKEIQDKPRFYPCFKDCIRAIDGTHVRVRVPNRDAPRYCGRTASDSRIIKDALTRDDKLLIPDGKYYLVDGGLPHRSTLIAPYRGVRYHLKEYSSRTPQNLRELFNLQHSFSSLRNSIERAFGVLKKRFPIIRTTTEPFYSCDTQSDIFLACCILHNFLLEVDRDKELEDEVIHEMLDASHDEEPQGPRDTDHRGEQIRNSIANDMWSDYMLNPNNEINMSI
ncbi:putative nuclease HARBI1 [Tanacetum coccineum]